MGNVVVVVRQGVIASLTGGFVYEPGHGNFCNVLHLYIWLFLLFFPLTLFWTISYTPAIWIAYSSSVAILFILVKCLNFRLHVMFDSKDTKTIILTEAISYNPSSEEAEKDNKSALDEMSQHVIETSEGIEMTGMAPSNQWVASPSMTPPVLCSSRMSVSDSSGSGRKLKKQDGTQDIVNKVLNENPELKVANNDSEWKICSTDAISSHHQSEKGRNRMLVKTGSVVGTKYREAFPGRNIAGVYSFVNAESCDFHGNPQNSVDSPHFKRLVNVEQLPGSAVTVLDQENLLFEKGDSCERSLNEVPPHIKTLVQQQYSRYLGHKGRHHKHRRAVRRARSTVDPHVFSESDEFDKNVKRHSSSDKAGLDGNEVSNFGVCLGNEHNTSSKDSLKEFSEGNADSTLPLKLPAWLEKRSSLEDAFSLSSYKETSPEIEVAPHSIDTKFSKKSCFIIEEKLVSDRIKSNIISETCIASKMHRRVSIDDKVSSFHSFKSVSHESSSPDIISTAFFSKDSEFSKVFTERQLLEKIAHFPAGLKHLGMKHLENRVNIDESGAVSGARAKDSFYINLSDSGEDVSESVPSRSNNLSTTEKSKLSKELITMPLQKDAMCQTKLPLCKKSCMFALDDAALKKHQLQQQRMSMSAHPVSLSHNRLTSILGRSSSYHKHKASKDLVMNAGGSSQVIDASKLKGSNSAIIGRYASSVKDRKKLCPSSSLTTVMRHYKRCSDENAVAQRLAHHSCTAFGGVKWLFLSDSDTHSSDEESINFDPHISSDSLSSPTNDDDAADQPSFLNLSAGQKALQSSFYDAVGPCSKKTFESKSTSPMVSLTSQAKSYRDPLLTKHEICFKDEGCNLPMEGNPQDISDEPGQILKNYETMFPTDDQSTYSASTCIEKNTQEEEEEDIPSNGDSQNRKFPEREKRKFVDLGDYEIEEAAEVDNKTNNDGDDDDSNEKTALCQNEVEEKKENNEYMEFVIKVWECGDKNGKDDVFESDEDKDRCSWKTFKRAAPVTETDACSKIVDKENSSYHDFQEGSAAQNEIKSDGSSVSSYHSDFYSADKRPSATPATAKLGVKFKDEKIESGLIVDNLNNSSKDLFLIATLSNSPVLRGSPPSKPPKNTVTHYYRDCLGRVYKVREDPNSPSSIEGCPSMEASAHEDSTTNLQHASRSSEQRTSDGLNQAPPPAPPSQWNSSNFEMMVRHVFEQDTRLSGVADSSQLSGIPPSLDEELEDLCSDDSSSVNCWTGFTRNKTRKSSQPKKVFILQLLPSISLKVRFNRQALQSLLDRNDHLEMFFSILLAITVSGFCSLLLSFGVFKDLEILLCFIVAGSQYSLLKSVQPDAASPIHGHNWIVVYSRPVYFCLCAFIIFLLHTLPLPEESFYLYKTCFNPVFVLATIKDVFWFLIVLLPLTFVLGLLPQVNTFMLYLIEQIEIHIFGGTAVTSLLGALYSCIRSIVCVGLLCGLCFAFVQNSLGTPLLPNTLQHVFFSIFCGTLVAITYHLSRCTSDPIVFFRLIRKRFQWRRFDKKTNDDVDIVDPLPEQLEQSVSDRIHSDLVICLFTSIFVFAISVSTTFSSPILTPPLFDLLIYLSSCMGFLIHWVMPQLRIETPWMCLSHPILKSHERQLFETKALAVVTWFEKMYMILSFIECNIILPATLLSALTISTHEIIKLNKFSNPYLTTFIIVVCGFKMFRFSFVDPSFQYCILIFTNLLFQFDLHGSSETFLVDYFFVSIFLHKVRELMLKLKFVMTYIAPWQITWGSAFHAFAQPFFIPHSAFLFLQTVISSVVSAPLNPLLGSAIFLISYVRPVKFWEKDYNTKRVDHTNTRLVAQIDRSVKFDDDNLNSIFYEHLTRSLQKSLCGDLALGRWGVVSQGDCFVMASDYLNALVHLVEMGNGFVTFQLRGLEFRGTYCQQREVEAITEDVDGDKGFCCCKAGHLPHFLSFNASFNQRWLAWQVVAAKFVVEGYSVSDNSAASMLQVYDLRKMLITFYVKSIIYYAVRSPKLNQWLTNKIMEEGLSCMTSKEYVDVDPTFAPSVDSDYDPRRQGVSRSSFCEAYLDWIQYCASRRDKALDAASNSFLVTLCFGLSLLGRRSLGTDSHNNSSANVEFFLYGLHSLFKGDIRINSVRDEWVFADMELLRRVIAPGIRMSLKLHQDHFASPDEYDKNSSLYDAITSHESNMVISHEGDPAWRNAVLSNVPSLLALRHVFDEGTNEYKVIMLTKRYLSFRIIKVNKECVRGFWAGQLQELIFLRNNNSERGSIQNAKQSLRNIINSSCDQPIGYPIYVSPLTTSYLSTNSQYSTIAGKEISFPAIFAALKNVWSRLKRRCSSSCTSGRSTTMAAEQEQARNPPNYNVILRSRRPHLNSSIDQSNSNIQNRGSLTSTGSSNKHGVNLPSFVGFVTDQQQQLMQQEKLQHLQQQQQQLLTKDSTTQRVQIIDPTKMFDNINLGRPIDVQWPNEEWRKAGGKSGWNGWIPEKGMEGVLVHRWTPCHCEPSKRSHIDKTILLVKIGEQYVPLTEAGVAYLT